MPAPSIIGTTHELLCRNRGVFGSFKRGRCRWEWQPPMLERQKFKTLHSENTEREVNSLLETSAHIHASVGRVGKSCDILRASLPATHRGSGLMAGPPGDDGDITWRAEPPCEGSNLRVSER